MDLNQLGGGYGASAILFVLCTHLLVAERQIASQTGPKSLTRMNEVHPRLSSLAAQSYDHQKKQSEKRRRNSRADRRL
jgi:hypothetical protein